MYEEILPGSFADSIFQMRKYIKVIKKQMVSGSFTDVSLWFTFFPKVWDKINLFPWFHIEFQLILC